MKLKQTSEREQGHEWGFDRTYEELKLQPACHIGRAVLDGFDRTYEELKPDRHSTMTHALDQRFDRTYEELKLEHAVETAAYFLFVLIVPMRN